MSSKRDEGRSRNGLTYHPQEKARINAGLCNRCGAPRAGDGTEIACRACAKRKVEYMSALRRKRYEAGLCIDCGKERNNSGQRCVPCADKQNSAAYYYKHRAK